MSYCSIIHNITVYYHALHYINRNNYNTCDSDSIQSHPEQAQSQSHQYLCDLLSLLHTPDHCLPCPEQFHSLPHSDCSEVREEHRLSTVLAVTISNHDTVV